MLAEYERLLPGCAGRLLAMAETVATGRIENETRLTQAEVETAKHGQAFAFLLTLVAFVASIVFFAVSNIVAGIAFISFPVVMLVRSFLGHTRSEKREPPAEQQDPPNK